MGYRSGLSVRAEQALPAAAAEGTVRRSVPRDWTGEEWEAHCLRIWRLAYGSENVQEIPSERKRDLGIEAFTFGGLLLQCYAPVEPLSVKDRYSVQRGKLTEDLRKLEDNAEELTRTLGRILASRYVFMVPIFDGHGLIAHGARKAEDVRGLGLPFIADDFKVVILTDEDYPLALAQLIREGEIAANIPVIDVAADDVAAWTSANDPLVENLTRKLHHVLGADETKLVEARKLLLDRYLAGEGMLGGLRQEDPELWGIIDSIRRAREISLKGESVFSDAPARTRFNEVRRAHRDELAAVPGVSDQSAEQLAWAATSDWLLHCPLDFPEQA